MLKEKIFRSKASSLWPICTLLLFFNNAKAFTQAPATTGSTIGIVYKEDMKKPVENAIVKIRNIENGKEYQSTPTDKNGFYRISDIEEGIYILGVASGEKYFNFKYRILIKVNEIAFLPIGLKSGSVSVADEEAGKMDADIQSFFPHNAGNAVFNSSTAESALVVYGIARFRRPVSNWKPWWKHWWQPWRWMKPRPPWRTP